MRFLDVLKLREISKLFLKVIEEGTIEEVEMVDKKKIDDELLKIPMFCNIKRVNIIDTMISKEGIEHLHSLIDLDTSYNLYIQLSLHKQMLVKKVIHLEVGWYFDQELPDDLKNVVYLTTGTYFNQKLKIFAS
jgi:hypothetical protein